MIQEQSITIAKPFIKWVGGKQSLIKTLKEYFPDNYDRYYEPFIGGGAFFFDLSPEDAVINDANLWLVDTYKAIKQDYLAVAEKLESLTNSKENFLKIRSINPSTLSLIERAAHFIYLNKTCFRGLFRVNKKGFFNVPYGEYDRRYFDLENLKAVSEKLQRVDIRSGDFEKILLDVSSGDFVYFDPPYYKEGGFSDFNRYTADQFHEIDHLRLATVCNELDRINVKWALSNSNTDFVRRLFEGYNFIEVDARREINLNSKKRNIKELLITNY